jgi:hypothetical protein
MKRTTIFKHFLMSLLLAVSLAGSASAGSGWVLISTVEFDEQAHEVGGISETYLTYDIAYNYDAVADGLLYYTSPLEVIDGDYGEGIDDTYIDIIFGVMYGIEVDYYTADYRPNKVVCADTEHWARLVFIPLEGKGYYDPYQLSQRTPGSYESFHREEIPSVMTETYSSSEYEYLGYTYACIRTPTVGTVQFQEMNGSAITDNPTRDLGNGVILGGGKRIFPDRQTPDDTVNRSIVKVKAQLLTSGGDPVYTSGAKVFFKNFDVDDPSTDSNVDDNGTTGNDNRERRGDPQAAGSFVNCVGVVNGLCYGLTNSNGEVSVDFSVTKQPGDNFVIAVSTDDGYLNGISVNGTGLRDSSNQALPTARAKRSEMLTVWRKLHIEVDSMAESQGNYEAGRIYSKVTVGQTPVTINITGTPSLEEGRFQGGRLQLDAATSLRVLDNTTNQLQVVSEGSPVSLRINQLFYLFDDDDFDNDDGGQQDGDDGEDIECLGTLPRCFDGTFSLVRPSSNPDENVFAAAYVEPEYEWAANQGFNQSNLPFLVKNDRNNADGDSLAAYFNPYRNTRNTGTATYERDDFWVAYFAIGYQSGINPFLIDEDGDPYAPNQPAIIGGGFSPADDINRDLVDTADDSFGVWNGSIGSILFIEGMSDLDRTVGASVNNWTNRLAAHELGHQLGLRGDTTGWGLMTPAGNSISLTPSHVGVIRWRVWSPGERNF